MAFEKLPVPEMVVTDSLRSARSVGTEAGLEAYHSLEAYMGRGKIFQPDQVMAYAQLKSDEAASQYLNERIEGHHNNLQSEAPGLAALVFRPAKNHMEGVFELARENLFGIEITEVEDHEDRASLYIVRMPEGGYRQINDRMLEFSDGVEQGSFGVHPTQTATRTARIASSLIVTIAGEVGEYWQNSRFTPGGVLRSLDSSRAA